MTQHVFGRAAEHPFPPAPATISAHDQEVARAHGRFEQEFAGITRLRHEQREGDAATGLGQILGHCGGAFVLAASP